MSNTYLLKARKLVTVTDRGTLHDAGMVVENGTISVIAPWQEVAELAESMEVIDCSRYVVTPGLVDCHTHLLEFAPGAVYPITQATHVMGGQALLMQALSCGITALGEQICGYHKYDLSPLDFRNWTKQVPMDVVFSSSTISIGFRQMVHFSAATRSQPIGIEQLTDKSILRFIAEHSEYPGENLFINATPANFTEDFVPCAGEVVYEQHELDDIVRLFHEKGKRIGAHVGGERAISMALDAGIDVLHHAHGISDSLIERAARQNVSVVATPIGGTHLLPNSPDDIVRLMENGVVVAISTDAFLPPHPGAVWLPDACMGKLLGPESLMLSAHPAMKRLHGLGWDENAVLALITRNAAQVMGRDGRYGQLREGMDANFVVASGVPGLEITEPEDVLQVYYQGVRVIDRSR